MNGSIIAGVRSGGGGLEGPASSVAVLGCALVWVGIGSRTPYKHQSPGCSRPLHKRVYQNCVLLRSYQKILKTQRFARTGVAQ